MPKRRRPTSFVRSGKWLNLEHMSGSGWRVEKTLLNNGETPSSVFGEFIHLDDVIDDYAKRIAGLRSRFHGAFGFHLTHVFHARSIAYPIPVYRVPNFSAMASQCPFEGDDLQANGFFFRESGSPSDNMLFRLPSKVVAEVCGFRRMYLGMVESEGRSKKGYDTVVKRWHIHEGFDGLLADVLDQARRSGNQQRVNALLSSLGRSLHVMDKRGLDPINLCEAGNYVASGNRVLLKIEIKLPSSEPRTDQDLLRRILGHGKVRGVLDSLIKGDAERRVFNAACGLRRGL